MLSKHLRELKRQALVLIGELPPGTMASAVEVRSKALAAYGLACDAKDRLLQAEALLRLGRSAGVIVAPQPTLAALRDAERIFLANGLHHKAASCRVAAARALYDLGREGEAITVVRAALAQATLPSEDRAAAFILLALCHGHQGDLDLALRLLTAHALPLVRSDEAAARLLPHALRAQGLMLLQVMICKRWPELWRGPAGSPPVLEPAPTLADVVSLFDQASAALPAGQRWGYIEMARQVALGLGGAGDEALVELDALISDHAAADPPLAGWALFCKATLLRHLSRPRLALQVLAAAGEIAQTFDLTALRRDVLLHQSRTLEALGDMAAALAAYKDMSVLAAQSTRLPIGADVPSLDEAFEDSRGSRPALTASEQRLRPLEPAHVRRAVRFIDGQLPENITVGDVVRHCGVSRRTLEVAFKESKASTIGQYIKQARLERASRALLDTDLPVQAVARSVGYRSPAAFSRDFRARFGVVPTAWKDAH